MDDDENVGPIQWFENEASGFYDWFIGTQVQAADTIGAAVGITPDTTVGQAFSQAEQGVEDATGLTLPSQTEVWFYIVAVIVILILVAYIAREVVA